MEKQNRPAEAKINSVSFCPSGLLKFLGGLLDFHSMTAGNDETQALGFRHRMRCPYCEAEIIVFHPSQRILAASRTCPACKQEFFIENGVSRPI
jgi:hypothetical protein